MNYERENLTYILEIHPKPTQYTKYETGNLTRPYNFRKQETDDY